jgi:hypothetical protein
MKAAQNCKSILLDLVEEAVLEAEWREECCRSLVLDMVEDAVKASREKTCRQVLEEGVLEVCWEALEVTRIVKEAEVGGMSRMERVETQLRGPREDEELLVQMMLQGTKGWKKQRG